MKKIMHLLLLLSFISNTYAESASEIGNLLEIDRQEHTRDLKEQRARIVELRKKADTFRLELEEAKDNGGWEYKTSKYCLEGASVVMIGLVATTIIALRSDKMVNLNFEPHVWAVYSGILAGVCHVGYELSDDEIELAVSKVVVVEAELAEAESVLNEELEYLKN